MEQNKNTETSEKKEKRCKHIYKQKSYLTAGIVTLVAAVAMVGAYQYERKSTQQKQSETAALTENEWTSPKADTSSDISSEEDTQETLAAQTPEQEVSDALSNPANDTQASSSDLVQETADTEAVAGQTQTVEEPVMHFSASDTIAWPLEGNVILNYSMDQSVYFATLDQYRYNPAVIIAGHVNDKVTAASDGQVIGVDTTAETGETVTIGLGDGYQAIYGQLKEVEVSAGDYVSQGDVIGYVAEPTKYYAVEGANLYFAMTKSGKPINPMDYIR